MLIPAKKSSKQKGQALLIILLVMAVILTIALSIASRSVTDISISKQEDDASRAFSAAEAGIEQALNGGTLSLNGSSLSSGGTFQANVTPLIGSGGTQFVVPVLVSSGEAVPIWFANHDTNNNNALVCNSSYPCSTATTFDICWGTNETYSDATKQPAIEISVFYTTSGNNWATAKIARTAYDPLVGRTGTPANNFKTNVAAGENIAGTDFKWCAPISLTNTNVFNPIVSALRPNSADPTGPQFLRIKLFYNDNKAHPVGIKITDTASGTQLPPQGNDVSSLGQSGDAARKVEVKQQFRDLPPVFDFGLYSGSGSITQ